MHNGNLYGLAITVLTFALTVVLAVKQVQETGVRFELVVQPVKVYTVAARSATPQEPKPGNKGEAPTKDGEPRSLTVAKSQFVTP